MSELLPPPPPPPPDELPSTTAASPAPANITWWKPRKSWKWWTATGVAALVLVIVIGAIATPTKKPIAANIAAGSTSNATVAPTFTLPSISPVGTPFGCELACAPVVTAAPTAAPTAHPTAAPVVGFTKSGRGDSVFTIPAPYNNEAAIVKVKYTGSSNFALETLGSDNSLQQLLVNTIGGFSGVEAMDFDGSSPATRMQVTASGSWTMTFSDPTTAPNFANSVSGRGDNVLQYSGNANTAAFTSTGQGNFAVLQFDSVGQFENLLVNTIGAYSGSVPIDSSRYLVITDDGKWTVALSNS